MPPAAPPLPSRAGKAGDATLAALRTRIAEIERHRVSAAAQPDLPVWTLGDERLDDAHLGGGLDGGAVHEVRPPLPAPGRSAALDRAAAFAFALRLAVRALAGLAQDSPRRAILCCTTPETRLELGEVHAAGIAAAGLDPRRLVLVSAAGNADALWAIEEALKSHALATVIGCVDAIELTPARRLSLAAAAHATPCLLLQPARSAPAAAVASRWQAGAAPSAAHPFDPAAPGRPAWNVLIERALGRGGNRMTAPLRVEWCDDALRFRVAAGVADRAARAHEPGRRFLIRAAGAG